MALRNGEYLGEEKIPYNFSAKAAARRLIALQKLLYKYLVELEEKV